MTAIIDSNRFTYSKETQTFVVDLSDVQAEANEYGLAVFCIRSTRTGDIRLFNFEGVDYDHEGDVAGYRFVNASQGLRALLIND